MIIICQNCKHEWNYKGNSKYATCPECHYKVNVSKQVSEVISKYEVEKTYNDLLYKIKELEGEIKRIEHKNYVKSMNRGDTNKKIKKMPGILIKCGKCQYEWHYTGIKRVARCPECNSRVKVEENKIKEI